MSHSPEPWKITQDHDLVDASGVCLEVQDSGDGLNHCHWGLKPEDMRRIVACVNACKGFTTEQLEAAAKGEALCIIGNSRELREIIENAPDEGFVEVVPAEWMEAVRGAVLTNLPKDA